MDKSMTRSALPLAGTASKYVVLIAGAVIMLLPFFWLVNSSLMTSTEIQHQPPVWFAAVPQWSNFSDLFNTLPLGRLYLNSLFVTGCIVFGVLFTSSLAGFAFAKYQFPGRELLFYAILATLMIPFFVTLIPVFYIVHLLGWIDNYAGLIVPFLTSAYGIFLMRQFIFEVPDEYIDAARIDGASEPLIYLRVVLPLVRPALATLGTFTFISNWNAFLWPSLVVNNSDLNTITLGVNSLRVMESSTRNLNLLMVGTTLSVIPTLIVFIFLQRYFIRGIALTGLK